MRDLWFDGKRSKAGQVTRRKVLQVGAGAGIGGAALAMGGGAASQTTHAQTPEAVTPRAGDPVSFSYLRPTWGPATFVQDGPYQQQLEQLGNVDIEVQIVPVIDYDTRINTVLASGEIPDVVWGLGPGNQIWRDAQDQGAFAPINEHLEAYPAVKAAVPQEFWDLLASVDDEGNIYFIPNLIYPIVPFFMFYRQDIFEAQGIAEPTTVDELVAALEQLAGDPNMSPLTMGYTWHAKDLGTSFGFAEFGWQPEPNDANTIIPWFTQQAQIDFHFWFQDLHERLLLDQNYGLNPEPNLSDDRFKGGQSVVAMANWLAFPDFATNLRQVAPEGQIGVISPLGEGAGNRLVFPIDRGFYVSAAMENVAGFFDFLNWTLTDGNQLRRYGVEGKTYVFRDGRHYPIPDVDREEGFRGPQIEPVSFLDPFDEKLDWEQMQISFESAGVGDQFEYIRGKFEEYAANSFPDYRNPMIISPTEGEDGSRLYEDILRPVIDSVIINHERTQDDWATALQQWRDNGGDQIIAEVNELQEDKSKPDYGV